MSVSCFNLKGYPGNTHVITGVDFFWCLQRYIGLWQWHNIAIEPKTRHRHLLLVQLLIGSILGLQSNNIASR